MQNCARLFRRLAIWLLVSIPVAAQSVSPDFYNALQWRLIGPFRGGRVASVAGIPGDATTFYFGAVDGGVWQTTSGGAVWKPIFDSQRIASIGALAIRSIGPKGHLCRNWRIRYPLQSFLRRRRVPFG